MWLPEIRLLFLDLITGRFRACLFLINTIGWRHRFRIANSHKDMAVVSGVKSVPEQHNSSAKSFQVIFGLQFDHSKQFRSGTFRNLSRSTGSYLISEQTFLTFFFFFYNFRCIYWTELIWTVNCINSFLHPFSFFPMLFQKGNSRLPLAERRCWRCRRSEIRWWISKKVHVE